MRAKDVGWDEESEEVTRAKVRGLVEETVWTWQEREGKREEEAAMDWGLGVDKVGE